MTTNYKTLALAREVEEALKNYLGTDSFPTMEWPRLALAFAKVVEQTGATLDGTMTELEVRSLIEGLSELNNAAAGLVGL